MIDISAFRTEPDEPDEPDEPVTLPPVDDAYRKEMAVWRDILDGADAW